MENLMFYRVYNYNGYTLAAIIFFFLALACALPTCVFLFNILKQNKQLKHWLYLYILLILTFLMYLFFNISPRDFTPFHKILAVLLTIIGGCFILYFAYMIQDLKPSGLPILKISLALSAAYGIIKIYSIINFFGSSESSISFIGDLILLFVGIYLIIVSLRTKKIHFTADQKWRRLIPYSPFLILIIYYIESCILYESFRSPGIATSLAWLFISFYLIGSISMKMETRGVQTLNGESKFQNSYGLTKREQTIASLLMKDYTYKEISSNLYISVETVKTHAYNIYKKTDIHHRRDLKTKLYGS